MENVEETDEGEMLVLRRALNGLRGTKEEKQGTSFTLRVLSKGKYALSLLMKGAGPM